MLTFATELPLSTERSPLELLELAKTWLVGSPHRTVTRSSLPEAIHGEVVEREIGSQKVTLVLTSENGSDLIGFRHSYLDDGQRQWTLELVGNKTDSEFWCSVRASCDSVHAAPVLPKSRKPFIIKQLLKFGTGPDGGVSVSDKPIILAQPDIDKAVSLILGNRGNRLPVIYVSAESTNRHFVDPTALAHSLAGLAHVLVEPSRSLSFFLRDKVDGRNAYAGAIGIYWPGQSGQRQILLPEHFQSPDTLAAEVVNSVEIALINRRPSSTCSWGWLLEVQSRQKTAALKAQGSTSLDQFADLYEQELRSKEVRISEAETEINRLKIEINRLESLSNTQNLLLHGSEVDLYSDERRFLLVLILKQALNNVKPDSRRAHIIKDIISANSKQDQNPVERLADSIQRILRGYKKIGKKERSDLEEIGFTFVSENNHYKLVFGGDNRYTYTIAKTPSDPRAGLNAASTIKTKLC